MKSPAPKLLFLTEHYFPSQGGMAQSCDRIVRNLRQAGVGVDVAHFSERWSEMHEQSQVQGLLFRIPSSGDSAHVLNCAWNLFQKQSGYTHLIAFGGFLPLLSAPVYSAWMRVPLLVFLRGNDFDAGIFNGNRRFILEQALCAATRVCAVSREKVEKLNLLYPEVDAIWIPNGIDLASWQPLGANLSRAQAWRDATVQPGKRVFGLFGQIKAKKGGLFLLEQMHGSGWIHRAHLLLIGELSPEVQDWLRHAPAGFPVTALPFLDRYELLNYYPACDYVVLPSLYDGMPNVLLEAMALGIPLLASHAGAMRDVIQEGEHGFRFEPGDPVDFRKALGRALDCPDQLYKKLRESCLNTARSVYSATQETNAYLTLLNQTKNP